MEKKFKSKQKDYVKNYYETEKEAGISYQRDRNKYLKKQLNKNDISIEKRKFYEEELDKGTKIFEQLKNERKVYKDLYKKNPHPSLYQLTSSNNDSASFSSFLTEKKQSRQWDEKMKNQSNQEAGCSHWERRANQYPFTSPFKK